MKESLKQKIRIALAKEMNVKSSQITLCESCGDINRNKGIEVFAFNVCYNKYLSKGYNATIERLTIDYKLFVYGVTNNFSFDKI